MINFNGAIDSENIKLSTSNRGFLYGDAVFETCKVVQNRILFFEDHYFRLMSSMRIVRMKIPMNFTLEFLESEVLRLIEKLNPSDAFRVRITVYRNEGGLYLPSDNSVSYVIAAEPLENSMYLVTKESYEVDLYKDFFITKQLLSSIKSTNRTINVTGSIFAKENSLNNCLLLNNDKNVIEALNGNLFMLTDSKLITPPVSDGCLNGVMRKQILSLAKKIDSIEVVEASISSFELQKAEELFITNVITGIQPITKYRKKEYTTNLSELLTAQLNEFSGL
jgi:branched-chain amino acid aminotransferase